jgi:hypothetical protein
MVHVRKTQAKLLITPVAPATPSFETSLIPLLFADDVNWPISFDVRNLIDGI